jgi:small subunit ribosomal protein S5
MENEELNKAAAPVEEKKPEAAPAPKAAAPVAENKPADFKKPYQHGGDHRDFRGGKGGRSFGHRPPMKKDYEEKVVHIGKVCKVVKGGKRIRFSATVVIGNEKGRFGYGIGKSIEVPEAIKKAIAAAHNQMIDIPVIQNDTIPHEVEGTFGACKVFLKPAPAGTGIVAGGAVRAILELAGIKNVYSKVYGSRCPINVIKATVNGCKQLRTISLAQELLNKEKEAKEAKTDEVK